jgi:hypothetical protein
MQIEIEDLTEYSTMGTGKFILNPDEVFRAIMGPYEWEKCFPGIRTTMNRWEYCALVIGTPTVPNIALSVLSGKPDPNASKYYHPTHRNGRFGPGASSQLRKNSTEYSSRLEQAYGPFRQDFTDGGMWDNEFVEQNISKFERYSELLIRHGEKKGNPLLQLGGTNYHKARLVAAKAFGQLLVKSQLEPYRPPIEVRKILREIAEKNLGFNYFLAKVVRLRRSFSMKPFLRVILASATLKLLYGVRFDQEEERNGNQGYTPNFAKSVVRKLNGIRDSAGQDVRIGMAIGKISEELKRNGVVFRPPLRNYYEMTGRFQILQNFRLPTWVNLNKQVIWVKVKDK